MTDVLTFGETMGAIRGTGPLELNQALTLSIAGAESNVAIGLARLGHSVQWIGRIGADELGRLVRRTLLAEAVDVSAVTVDPQRPTGMLLLETRIADLVRVAYFRSGSAGASIAASDVEPHVHRGVRIVHITGVTAALSESARDCVHKTAERARDEGATVSVDVNFRSRLWTMQQAQSTLRPLMKLAHIVFASQDELQVVADGDPPTAVRNLLNTGVEQVVIKKGSAGASVDTRDERFSTGPEKVPVVDVIGAGDAFVAGYLSALLESKSLIDRLRRGTRVAAFGISHRGDWEGLPTRDELVLLDLAADTTVR